MSKFISNFLFGDKNNMEDRALESWNFVCRAFRPYVVGKRRKIEKYFFSYLCLPNHCAFIKQSRKGKKIFKSLLNPNIYNTLLCCHLLLTVSLNSLERCIILFVIFVGEMSKSLCFWKIPSFTIHHLEPVSKPIYVFTHIKFVRYLCISMAIYILTQADKKIHLHFNSILRVAS